ncbi:MAG: hypothetical protein J0M12_15190 [Deltaproteobacteria bacterium]|nr:hypothetical protein [Deltaproteobacteria bacterium]
MKLRAYCCPICARPSAILPKDASAVSRLASVLSLGLAALLLKRRFCPTCLIEFTCCTLRRGSKASLEKVSAPACELAPETPSMSETSIRRTTPSPRAQREDEVEDQNMLEGRFLNILEDLLVLMDARNMRKTSTVSRVAGLVGNASPAPVLQLKKRG